MVMIGISLTGRALVFGPRRCEFESCIPNMYNHFIRPFTLSKALKTKSYVMKVNKLNKIFLKLFHILGLTHTFNYGHIIKFNKIYQKRATIVYQLMDASMIYNTFRFYKKHSFNFILTKRALNYVTKSSKIAYIISNDDGYTITRFYNKKGGKLVMSIGR